MYCSYKGMGVVSNNTQVGFLCLNYIFKPKTHHYTSPTSLNHWRQGGFMLSCYLSQILTLPSECHSRHWVSSVQLTFFQTSIVHFWWACVNCSIRFLFSAGRRGIRYGLLLLPICFKVRCVVCSEMLFCITYLERVTVAFLSAWTSQACSSQKHREPK